MSQTTASECQECPEIPAVPTGSITGKLNLAQQGDPDAFSNLWKRYFKRLVLVVQKQFQNASLHQIDPEDVVHSSFIALHEGFRSQKFDSLQSRNQLWSLLTIIAIRKACNRARREEKFRRIKDLRYAREFHQVGASRFSSQHLPVLDDEIKKILLEDHLEFFLRALEQDDPNQRLKEIAQRKLQGQSNAQIAKDLGCSRKSIALRLNLIFEIWKQGNGI